MTSGPGRAGPAGSRDPAIMIIITDHDSDCDFSGKRRDLARGVRADKADTGQRWKLLVNQGVQ